MRRNSGFTLVELMIVLGIIAIIAAFAVPSYLKYSVRARRADGQELLLRIANAQERFYATNNRYGALTELNYASPAISEKRFYSVTATPAAASTTQVFTATAAPQGAQVKDDCGSLRISNTGNKTAAGTTINGSCW